MTKARDLANAGTALGAVSATELGYVDGVTSAIQTQLDAKTAKSTLTTTGDIYYASGANTPARLGIGSTDQVLKVTAGIPSWATPSSGGMTLLQTLTCSGASVTSSTLSTSYTNLYIVGNGISASTNVAVFFRINGITASDYNYSNAVMSGAGAPANDSTDTTAGNFGNCGTGTGFNQIFTFEMNVPRYNTTAFKPIQIQSRGKYGASIENYISSRHNVNTTAAITTLTFGVSSGTFSSGSIYIYGVN
jgi:hypothetical protein